MSIFFEEMDQMKQFGTYVLVTLNNNETVDLIIALPCYKEEWFSTFKIVLRAYDDSARVLAIINGQLIQILATRIFP